MIGELHSYTENYNSETQQSWNYGEYWPVLILLRCAHDSQENIVGRFTFSPGFHWLSDWSGVAL